MIIMTGVVMAKDKIVKRKPEKAVKKKDESKGKIEKVIINGSPVPPEGYSRPVFKPKL
jgi:hypothetical protein